MKHKHHPQMAESFQPAYGIGLVVRRNQMKFAAAAVDQTWLAGTANFLYKASG
jgi:uncharacterized membrane protein YdbT with pleckstrin-like domain